MGAVSVSSAIAACALLWVVACQSKALPPGDTPRASDGAGVTGPGFDASPTDATPDQAKAVGPVPSGGAWASWPMPNSPSTGLPNPRSYDTRVSGVVVDRVTGLMWQQNVSDTFESLADARAQCSGIRLGGYDDWRLPSRIELVSILDATRTQPSIDVSAFPGTPNDWFWTSSVAANNPQSAWYVYFYFGYPNTDDVTNRFSVRCVRSTAPTAVLAPRYDVQGGQARDIATGLTWQRSFSDTALPVSGARSYCGSLALEGQGGFRVPSFGELLTLIDERAVAAPLIDVATFPNTPSESFWSASNFADGPEMAWYVSFAHGNGLYDLATASYRVRCVR